MNIHKNARLTFARRQEMVRDMIERQLTPCRGGRRARRQRAHGTQVARSLSGPRRDRVARCFVAAIANAAMTG